MTTPITSRARKPFNEGNATTMPLNPTTEPLTGVPERRRREVRLLTVPEVMAALSLSRSTIYDLIRSGELASVQIGRARRIPESALTAYIDRLLQEAC